MNKFFPGLSAENFPATPTKGVIASVAIHRITGIVTAIGLEGETLPADLGQQHPVLAGLIPEIGKKLAGVEVTRNAYTGEAL